jgi:protein-L-isoaspartate(D-aspartate) O-methyltransferase
LLTSSRFLDALRAALRSIIRGSAFQSDRATRMSLTTHSATQEEQYGLLRAQMVRDQIAPRGIVDPLVLAAMAKVPRHLFVPDEARRYAYDDGPLLIGAGQTISQPYIVALMTQLIQPGPEDRVLEVGVGSGYQMAVLAEIAREAVGIERIGDLACQAELLLRQLGYRNVAVHIGDGTLGYAPSAPYNGIIVSAAAPEVPEPLIAQLAEGGRLVIPVGDSVGQVIERITLVGGIPRRERLTDVRFVPLIGRHGFKRSWG